MDSSTHETLLEWVEQAKRNGYVWPDLYAGEIPDYEKDSYCNNWESCRQLVMVGTGRFDIEFGWRHYRPDRITKTDVYWVVIQGGEPQKAVLHECGFAYNPVTGIGFDAEAIQFFHELTPPAGPEI